MSGSDGESVPAVTVMSPRVSQPQVEKSDSDSEVSLLDWSRSFRWTWTGKEQETYTKQLSTVSSSLLGDSLLTADSQPSSRRSRPSSKRGARSSSLQSVSNAESHADIMQTSDSSSSIDSPPSYRRRRRLSSSGQRFQSNRMLVQKK